MGNTNVTKKIEQVDELTAKFKEAKTIVSFDYPGLTVENFMKLRKQLRAANWECKVYKNNISRRAAIKAGFDALSPNLVGAKAIAISFDDVVAPAKIIYEFSKANKQVVIHSGVIEGSVVGLDGIMALATLPSREGLLTQLAVGLLTPLRELAVGLNMIEK